MTMVSEREAIKYYKLLTKSFKVLNFNNFISIDDVYYELNTHGCRDFQILLRNIFYARSTRTNFKRFVFIWVELTKGFKGGLIHSLLNFSHILKNEPEVFCNPRMEVLCILKSRAEELGYQTNCVVPEVVREELLFSDYIFDNYMPKDTGMEE